MRIVCSNDWHFSKTPPVSRIDDYNEELFGLLKQLRMLVQHFKADALCVAGDIFHNKGLAPWDVVIRLLEWGRSLPCPILTIMGNHDQTHDRYESIDKTPYGVLTASGVFTDISRHSVVINGTKFYGVPWPDGSRPDAFAFVPEDTDVVLAHGFVSQEGGEKWGTYCHKYDDLTRACRTVKVWHFGHDHADHGVFNLSHGAQVINIGALSRGALDTDTIVRQVKAAVVTYEPEHAQGLQTVQVALKQRPVEEIFDLERHKERKAEQAQLEQFLDQLQQGLSGVLDVDYKAVLAGMPLDAAVREKVAEYLAQAEAA